MWILKSLRFVFTPELVRPAKTLLEQCTTQQPGGGNIYALYSRISLTAAPLRKGEIFVSYGITIQKHHRLLPSPAREWFNLHFQQSGFNGRFQIGIRRPEASSILPLTTQPLDRLPGFLASAHFSLRCDYYITSNSFHGVKRQRENLFSLHNVVIDVDDHTVKEHMFFSPDPLWAFLEKLKDAVSDEDDLPSPTSIVWTGRGLQLWWAIVPMSAKCLPWYEEIRDTFILRLQDLIEEDPSELEGLKVDSSASRNVVGYFRLPGTVNSKSQSLVEAEIWTEEQYDTHNLIKWAKKYKSEREADEVTSVPAHTYDDPFSYSDAEVRILKNVFTLAFFRVRQIIRLRSIRNGEIGDETRNNMNLIVYNALLLAHGAEKAWEKTLDFNAGFKTPMTEKELHNSLDTSTKKGGYRYKNESVISFLDISEAEQEQIGLYPSDGSPLPRLSGHPSRTAARRLSKQHRNQAIRDLSASGKKNSEIAAELGIAPNTVTAVLGAKRPRREEALEMKNAGMSNKDISAELGVSLRTIERYLRTATTEEEFEKESVSISASSIPKHTPHRVPDFFRRRRLRQSQSPVKSETRKTADLPADEVSGSDSS